MASKLDVDADDAFARDAPDDVVRETFGERVQHYFSELKQRVKDFNWTRKHTKLSIAAFAAACGFTAVVLLWVLVGTIAGMGMFGGIVFALAAADVARVVRSSAGAFGDDFVEPDDEDGGGDSTHASYGSFNATETNA